MACRGPSRVRHDPRTCWTRLCITRFRKTKFHEDVHQEFAISSSCETPSNPGPRLHNFSRYANKNGTLQMSPVCQCSAKVHFLTEPKDPHMTEESAGQGDIKVHPKSGSIPRPAELFASTHHVYMCMYICTHRSTPVTSSP
jgi:hypothetical protein